MDPINFIELSKRYNQQNLIEKMNCCQNLFDHQNDLIFILDNRLYIKLINHTAKSYYNFKNIDEIINQKITKLQISTKSLDLIINKINCLNHISLPSIKITTIEDQLSGQTTEINWTISYLLNSRKDPIGIFLLGKFNFEKNNEQKINYLQTCLDTIIDSVPGDIYWKNTAGVYLGCNQAVVKNSNFHSKEDIIGKTDDELWPGSPFRANDLAILAANKTTEIQETVTINNGKKLYFISRKTPLKDHSNKTIGIVGNSVDVTELINAKAKAEEANKNKTEFLLNMQHDIKTPISHIIGLSNIINAIPELPNRVKEYISYIKISSERLMNLIVDMLQNYDLTSNGSTLDEQEWQFNLLEILQKTKDLNIIPIKEKNLDFIINHDQRIPHNLIGHRDKLHRILINLIDNAIKFTHQGRIEVSTKLLKVLEYPKLLIELVVNDTGIGIPPDKHEAIFDRFIRLSPSSSNMYKGLGLGLWIVKQLAKSINGEIYVNSTIDQGSEFKLIFPCKAAYLE